MRVQERPQREPLYPDSTGFHTGTFAGPAAVIDSWSMLALIALLQAAEPAPFRFQRVDVLSEDPGIWLNDDAKILFQDPGKATLHFAEQIKVVWGLPIDGLTLGTSVLSQSLHFERPVFGFQSFTAGAGLQTFLLLPRGIWVDLAWHRGPVRLAGGVSVLSGASWTNLDWGEWHFLPTVGIGVGRSWGQR